MAQCLYGLIAGTEGKVGEDRARARIGVFLDISKEGRKPSVAVTPLCTVK